MTLGFFLAQIIWLTFVVFTELSLRLVQMVPLRNCNNFGESLIFCLFISLMLYCATLNSLKLVHFHDLQLYFVFSDN